VAQHEGDVFGARELGRHDEVALVLAIRIVHQDHETSGTELIEDFGQRGERHAREDTPIGS